MNHLSKELEKLRLTQKVQSKVLCLENMLSPILEYEKFNGEKDSFGNSQINNIRNELIKAQKELKEINS